MIDGYVDVLREGTVPAGDVVCQFNSFQTDRELFKLTERLALNELAGKRLSDDFVKEYILGPLLAAVKAAEAELKLSSVNLAAIRDKYEVGETTFGGWAAFDNNQSVVDGQIQEAEAEVLYHQAQIALVEKEILVDKDRRLFQAERDEIIASIKLLHAIRERFTLRFAGDVRVTAYAYPGSFVEEGDLVLTVAPL